MFETQITFTGWLGTDVTLRTVAGGHQVASFRVATTARRLKDDDWVTTSTTWHTVKAWHRLAVHAAQSLGRGDPVLVHGRLVADTWTRPDGERVTTYVVRATSVGHDLCQGTARFARSPEGEGRPLSGREDEAQARAVAQPESPLPDEDEARAPGVDAA